MKDINNKVVTTHTNKTGFFTSHDGTDLFFQHWKPKKASKKAIVMFHRGHEHSDRMSHIVRELGLDNYHFFAWDARGHGNSPGERGFAPSVAHVVKDIDSFITYLSLTYKIPVKNMIILGQSVGAVSVATWLHDYAPKVKAAILASPAFKVKLYVPLAIPALKLLKSFSKEERYVNSYVKGNFLSHDPQRVEEYNTDKNITKAISVGMLVDLHDTAKRIVADSYAVSQPVLMLVSGNDFVVEKSPQYEFFAKLASPLKELHELPDFYHDTLGEQNRELAYQYIRQFITKIENTPVVQEDLTKTNPYHFSYLELENLSRDSNVVEEKLFDFQSKMLKFGSQFSEALKVGERTGYDSGSTLDYVYQDQATSDNLFGKIIDRTFLNAIGWKGIRIRKENLEKAFKWVSSQHSDIKFVDIAAGHGRYDVDFLKTLPLDSFSATLSDYSELNVKAGQKLIVENGLSSNVRFVQGNAFSTSYVKEISTNANLVVVSGLYELYPDNNLLQASLAGISEGIEIGGYLVYTNQPWHPQLKFIAKVLTSHRGGDSWVMRRRTQEEMDQLVESNGFQKVQQYIDPYGIFTLQAVKPRTSGRGCNASSNNV